MLSAEVEIKCDAEECESFLSIGPVLLDEKIIETVVTMATVPGWIFWAASCFCTERCFEATTPERYKKWKAMEADAIRELESKLPN